MEKKKQHLENLLGIFKGILIGKKKRNKIMTKIQLIPIEKIIPP